jgi:hypothetical protein
LAIFIFPLLLFKHNINNKNINNRGAPCRRKNPAKMHIFIYKLPPKPQHRYPSNPNIAIPQTPTSLSPNPQHAKVELSPKPQHPQRRKEGNFDGPFQEFSSRSQASGPTTAP